MPTKDAEGASCQKVLECLTSLDRNVMTSVIDREKAEQFENEIRSYQENKKLIYDLAGSITQLL